MRALRLLINARLARAALERLLEAEHWPADVALSRAVDRLIQLEEEAASASYRISEALRRLRAQGA